jgi:hypothetical protein
VQDDAREPKTRGLTCVMKPKLSTPAGTRICAAAPIGIAERSRHGRATRSSEVQRRPHTANAQLGRKSGSARQTRSRSALFAALEPSVVDDFPQPIPVSSRELDVIETYLGALLDDALGNWE